MLKDKNGSAQIIYTIKIAQKNVKMELGSGSSKIVFDTGITIFFRSSKLSDFISQYIHIRATRCLNCKYKSYTGTNRQV